LYKAIIFYFSGTGNTWWVADKIKKLLDARNVNADIISIDNLKDGGIVDAKKADWLIKASDIVFFGWPVYGSDLPSPMKHFIDNLSPVAKSKHVHTFCTQMMFSGDGAFCYNKNFAKKGLIIDSCEHFIMPSNFSISYGLMSPPKTNEKTKAIMEKCELSISKYVSILLNGKSKITGKYSYPLGIIQRLPYRLLAKKLKKIIGVNKSICIKCGQCASYCPNANIIMKGFPEFCGQCALCLRCYSYCPVSAITARGKTRKAEKYGAPYRLADKRFSLTFLKQNKK